MYSAIAANKRNTVIIMAAFVGLVAGLGWLFSQYYLGEPSVTFWIVGASFIYVLIQYYFADKLAVGLMGAKEIEKRDNPRLYRIVENLAITTGIPTPKIYMIDDPAPNAFATGRDPKNALVGVTTGILDIMDDRELTAVMAHEIGHVRNYDIRVGLIAAGLASVISILADIALRIAFFGGNNRNNSNPIMLIIGIVAIILAPIIATLIQLAIGRQREYLADATSVMTTRDPEAMASALQKLGEYSRPMAKQSTTTAHMFLNDPIGKKRSFANLFSTHPPIESRIERIKKNSARM